MFAWAAQAHLDRALPRRLELAGNLLLLSPDDAYPGNGYDHTFFYSGKSRSSTLMLTEDEIRDWYDNLDERFGSREGGFVRNRAGLALADIKATWSATADLELGFVAGTAFVLRPENALDNLWAGLELDIVPTYRLADSALLAAGLGLLLPGPAASAILNGIDRRATDPVVWFELALLMRY